MQANPFTFDRPLPADALVDRAAELEQLLAMAASPLSSFNDIRGQLANSDIPWPTVKLSTGKEVRLDDQGIRHETGQ